MLVPVWLSCVRGIRSRGQANKGPADDEGQEVARSESRGAERFACLRHDRHNTTTTLTTSCTL